MSGNFADWMKYFSLSGLAAKIANIEKVIGTLPNTENPILNGTVTILGGPAIVDNQAGTARSVVYTSAGVPRWLVGADASAESGSNAGSNFVVQSYTDSGVANEQTLTISRTSGQVALVTRPTWGDGSGGMVTPWDSGNLNHDIYETVAAAEQAAAVAAAATAAAIVTAGENAAELYVPIINPVMQTGATIVNNESSNPSLTISAIGNGLGALIGMLGNGATAAAKYLQVLAGHFRILANDGATPLLDIDDSGNADFAGTVTALAFPNAALSGTPTAPTATAGDNSTAVATTAFVTAAVAAGGGGGPGGPYETVADAQVAYQNLEVYAQQQAAGAVTLAGTNAAQIYATIATANLLQTSKANVASPSFSGTVTILGNTVFGGSGPAGFTISNSSLSPRWETQILGTESGNSTGSNLTISGVNDQGTVTPALTVTRATGQSTFATRPQWVVGGANATPWDSANLAPGSIVTSTSPVFTNGDANSTSMTPAVTITNASNPVAGQLTFYPSMPVSGTNSLVRAGDAAMIVGTDTKNQALVIGNDALATGNPQGLRISSTGVETNTFTVDGVATIAGLLTGSRPYFNNNLAWDAGNFNPANYLTVQAAASTYVPMVSGVVQGSLGFVAPSTSTLFRGMTILSNTSAGNKTRWNIGSDIADTGSNNGGGDLRVYRYDDNGIWLGTALNIIRSSGAAQFSTRPTWLVNGAVATPWDSSNLNPNDVPTNVNPQFTNNSSTFGPSSAARFVNGTSPISRSIGIFPGLAATNYGNVVQQGDNAIVANPDLTTFASLAITPAGATNSRNVGIRMSPAPTGSYVPGTYDLQFFGYSIFDSPPSFPGLSCAGTSSFTLASTFGVRPTFAGNTPWDTGNLPGSAVSGTTTFSNTIVMPNGANITGGKYSSSLFELTTTFDGGVTYTQNSAIQVNGPQLGLSSNTNLTTAGPATFSGTASFSGSTTTFNNGFTVSAGNVSYSSSGSVSFLGPTLQANASFSGSAAFVNPPQVPTTNDAANGPGGNVAASTLYVQQAIAAQAVPKKGFPYDLHFPYLNAGGFDLVHNEWPPTYLPATWLLLGIATIGTKSVIYTGNAISWSPAALQSIAVVTLIPAGNQPVFPNSNALQPTLVQFQWENGSYTATLNNVVNQVVLNPGDSVALWAPWDSAGAGAQTNLRGVSATLAMLGVTT